MEENKNNNSQQNSQDGAQKTGVENSNIEGRLNNTQNPEFENGSNASDISNVDQQEGTMNRGETGGNFNPENSGTYNTGNANS